MNTAHRLACILSDIARAVGIEPTGEAFRKHSRSLERWNDRQWNAVGSDDVYFYSVSSRLFDATFDSLDLQHASEKAAACGMRSIAKRLNRVLVALRARQELAPAA